MLDKVLKGIEAKARKLCPVNLAEQDDLVADAVAASLRVFSKYSSLPTESQIKLAGRAAVNAMYDRKRKERPVFDLTLYPVVDRRQENELRNVDTKDFVVVLRERLTDRSRKVLDLRLLDEEITGDQIAKRIGVSPATVSRSFGEIRDTASELGLDS